MMVSNNFRKTCGIDSDARSVEERVCRTSRLVVLVTPPHKSIIDEDEDGDIPAEEVDDVLDDGNSDSITMGSAHTSTSSSVSVK